MKLLSNNYKTLSADIIYRDKGLGIVKCKQRRQDIDGNLVGSTQVWYDICQDNGNGDIIESRKTLAQAISFIHNY